MMTKVPTERYNLYKENWIPHFLCEYPVRYCLAKSTSTLANILISYGSKNAFKLVSWDLRWVEIDLVAWSSNLLCRGVLPIYGETAPQTKMVRDLCAISKLSTLKKKKKASWSKLPEKLKISIKILLGQAVLEILIKTLICTFWSITQKSLELLNF